MFRFNMQNVVISFPKCGRTWLRVLLGKAMCDQYGLDDKQCLDPPAGRLRMRKYPMFRHSITSDHTVHIASGDSWKSLPNHIDSYKNFRVCLLVRNPMDVMVSYFCHRSYRSDDTGFRGSISEFIRTESYGVDKLLYYWNLWDQNKAILKDYKVLTYEAMHADAFAVVRDVAEFCGLRVADKHLKAAVAFSKFESLKKKQNEQYFQDSEFAVPTNPEGQKVRRGEVGGYEDYLSADDVAYIKERMTAMRCPFYDIDSV